jgi:ectoine hydroxylase-related dioxygenase (phytanoyl-CoA dioxygenase family)
MSALPTASPVTTPLAATSTVAPDARPDVLPPQAITLSASERAAGRFDPENGELATAILACRGYVILRDALEPDFAGALAREMLDIYEDCRNTQTVETGTSPDAPFKTQLSSRRNATFWYRKSRWRIFPRLEGAMGDARLLANPFVVPILDRLLGDSFQCRYVSSDTCLAGAILQAPHSDISGDEVYVNGAWKPRGFVVNVPVMECGLHNGPLEVWPGGSHMWDSNFLKPFGLVPNVQDGRNPAVERLAAYFPSLKVVLQPGEILIRDLAMWHRGTPNPTDQPRTMLTIGMFRADHEYGYGSPSYNLDETLYERLDPRIRRMFAYHFTALERARRKLGRLKRKLLGPPQPA